MTPQGESHSFSYQWPKLRISQEPRHYILPLSHISGMASQEKDESLIRAELFDMLAHPTRIRILKTLSENPMSFTELKRALDIESNGLLQHHLGKLNDLVRQTPDGNYAITDGGKEALRSLAAFEQTREPTPKDIFHGQSFKTNLPLFGVVALGAVLLAIALFEYSLLLKSVPLFDRVDFSQNTLTLFGETYEYVVLSTAGLKNGTRVGFRGAVFTYIDRSYYVRPLNTATRGISQIAIASYNGGTAFSFGLDSSSSWAPCLIYSSLSNKCFVVEFEEQELDVIQMPLTIYGTGKCQTILRINLSALERGSWFNVTRREGGETLWVDFRGRDYPFVIGSPERALAFQLGPQTIILLVRSET